MNKTLIEIAGNKSLSQIIEKWQDVVLNPEDDEWLEYPPQKFLDFVKCYPVTPFDNIPESGHYLKQPTFLVAQAHRLWQTSYRVFKHLSEMNAQKFIDFGSLPFFLPFILRDYFGFKGDIITTTNIVLSREQKLFLDIKNLSVMKLDLDPYVSDPAVSSRIESLPITLDMEDGTVDFILASHVIEHLYHPRSLIKESFRLLKPGGKLMLSTDNAMMIDVFANYIAGYGYTFEPIEQTAAMVFHFWRGHVRFFTERDLTILVESEKFSVEKVEFFHCFYEVFFEDFFKDSTPRIAEWKRDLLKSTPWLRNDIAIIACR